MITTATRRDSLGAGPFPARRWRLRLPADLPAQRQGAQRPSGGDAPVATPAPRQFLPLKIEIAPDLSNAIALDPRFDVEES